MRFPDIFGRRRIAELEKANANLNRRLQEWEDEWKQQRMQATREIARAALTPEQDK